MLSVSVGGRGNGELEEYQKEQWKEQEKQKEPHRQLESEILTFDEMLLFCQTVCRAVLMADRAGLRLILPFHFRPRGGVSEKRTTGGKIIFIYAFFQFATSEHQNQSICCCYKCLSHMMLQKENTNFPSKWELVLEQQQQQQQSLSNTRWDEQTIGKWSGWNKLLCGMFSSFPSSFPAMWHLESPSLSFITSLSSSCLFFQFCRLVMLQMWDVSSSVQWVSFAECFSIRLICHRRL